MSTETKSQNTLIFVLLIVLFTAAGFFAGTKYQQKKVFSQRGQFFGRMAIGDGQGGGLRNSDPNNQFNRGRLGGRQVVGDIISLDDKSITVKLPDGSSKIVLLSDSVSISQDTAATRNDLAVGQRVGIFGSENTDGSVTAQLIQLNPALRGLNSTPAPTSQ